MNGHIALRWSAVPWAGGNYKHLVPPGTNDKTTVSLINDNITAPPADKAQVRVIHASPDVGEIDIVDKSANTKIFSGVNFERETSYMAVNPMKTTLEVRQEGQEKSVLTVPEANFEKGKYYTIVVTGSSKGMPKLQAVMIEDQLTATPATASDQKPQADEGKMVKAKGSKY